MLLHSRKSMQLGYSLVELMLAVSIFIILASLGVPSFQEATANAKVRSTAESVRNALQMARSEAVKLNANVTFTLNDDTSWTLGCTTPTPTCPAVIAEKSASEGSEGDVELTKVGGDDVEFTSLGTTTAVATQLSQVNITNSSVSEVRNLRVTIGAGGGTKVCDPKVTATSDSRAC